MAFPPWLALAAALAAASTAGAADLPAILSTPPLVVSATNVSITVRAEWQCPPNCDVDSVIWQLKPWVKNDWIRSSGSTGANFTFDGLVPNVQYDVRALLHRRGQSEQYAEDGVPVIKTTTCSAEVPTPTRFWPDDEREKHHIDVAWSTPLRTCASVRFLFQMTSLDYVSDSNMEGCPPPNLAARQPTYTCKKETSKMRLDCTARIENLLPQGKYYVGLIAVDWLGRCSKRDWLIIQAFKENHGKIGVGLIILVVGAVLLVAAAMPFLFKLRKRLIEGSLTGRRYGFSRSKPRTTSTEGDAETPIENDRDGYLLAHSEAAPTERTAEQPNI